MDQRIEKLAKNLVSHSCRVQKGEKVLIESFGESSKNLVKALIKETYVAGGYPFVTNKDQTILRELLSVYIERIIKGMQQRTDRNDG